MDSASIVALGMYGLGAAGLVLAAFRGRRAWRLEVAALLALTLLWVGVLVLALRDNAVGHDCTAADHGGELPSLLVCLAWATVLAIVLRRRVAQGPGAAVRVALPVATASLIAASLAVIYVAQPAGC